MHPPASVTMSTDPVPHLASAKAIFKHTRGAGRRSEVTALLEQTMDPISARLVRMVLPGEVTTLGTAVARTSTQSSVEWYSTPDGWNQPNYLSNDGTYTVLMNNPTAYYATLLRDPVVRAIVRHDRKAAEPNPVYEFEFGFGYERYAFTTDLQRATPVNLPISGMVPYAGAQVYGDWMPSGTHDGRRVIWLDASFNLSPFTGTNIKMYLHVANDAENFEDRLRLTVYREHQQGRNVDYSQVFTYENDASQPYNFFLTITLTSSAYYSFELEMVGNSGDTETAQITSLSMFYESNLISYARHIPTAGVNNKRETLFAARTLGASLLLSNTDPVVKRGGTVTLAQTSTLTPWYRFWSNDELLDTVNVQAKDVLSWDNGAYVYVKPQGSDPYQLKQMFTCNDCSNDKDHRPMPMFTPFGDSGQVIVRINPPNSGEENGISSLRLVTASALEFTTNDQFFNVIVSSLDATAHDEFIAALRLMPQFYDNPIHLAAIAALIKTAANTVVEWGPRVRSGIQFAERVAQHLR